MPREVTDGDGTTWSLVEAYAGLSEDGRSEAARVEGTDRFRVIATPTGGAQSAELELPAGWSHDLSDDELLKEIGAAAGVTAGASRDCHADKFFRHSGTS